MDKSEILFFLGKGGVGKSTVTLGQSIFYAERNVKTLVLSMDPAHNLQDIIDIKIKRRKEIIKNLWVEEVDIEKVMKGEAQSLKDTLNSISPYSRIFNLESLNEIIEFIPGLEEDALFEILKKVFLLEKEGFQKILIDMPPTGLALRVLALPYLKSVWFDALKKQRRRILELREIIFKEKREDDILDDIAKEEEEAKEILGLMKDERWTKFIVIVNRSSLSIKEAERIVKTLKNMNLEVYRVVVNKAYNEEMEYFKEISHLYKSEFKPEPKGIYGLRVFGPVL